ncbi:MAG: hypothetical protein ACXVB7_18480, partial [Ktedonobacteraceae bacterium]
DRLSSSCDQYVSLSLSRVSIPEICQECDHFAAFAGASAKYLGKRKEELMKKRRRQTGKERFATNNISWPPKKA